MPGMLVDTSGWGNLVDSSQPYHSLASSLYRDARLREDRIITTSYILVELVALLTSPLRIPRPDIIAFIEGVKQSPFIDIVYVDQTIDEAAWRLLRNRQDKDWSLVDCVSFVIMQQRNLIEALATDHHFEQAGFIRLLKS
jgi:predicted nucleic acid-binding protein